MKDYEEYMIKELQIALLDRYGMSYDKTKKFAEAIELAEFRKIEDIATYPHGDPIFINYYALYSNGESLDELNSYLNVFTFIDEPLELFTINCSDVLSYVNFLLKNY